MTRILSEKIKPFDTKSEPIMSNLANRREILRFNYSVLVLKSSSLLYRKFILNVYIVFELDKWPHNLTNKFTLKDCLFGAFKLIRNSDKKNLLTMVKE